MRDVHDYIIVGAGTAGCVLASRLTGNPGVTVLLLEAGGAERPPELTVPDAWPEAIGSAADWGFVTTPQAGAGPVPYPRGRVVGGSGSINAMAHIRGHRAVYDAWPPGWRFADLLLCFRRSESAPGRDPALRGTAGPVRVGPVPAGRRHPVAAAFHAGTHAAGVTGMSADLSGAAQEGACWVDLAIADGRRAGPAEAYLGPALSRPGLSVLPGCLVTRLQITAGGRCEGVRYVRDGVQELAYAARDVIVCAGAIGSPQLLMLSGIGPAAHLAAHGITVAADLPAVGDGLQDHPIALIGYKAPAPLPRSAYNHGEVYAAVSSAWAGAYPDLHLFPILLPLIVAEYAPGSADHALAAAVMAPQSTGSVRLASADPAAAPLIDPGFLREGNDVDRLEAGLRLLREVAASAPFAALGEAEAWPGPGPADHQREYIRQTVRSYWHPAGTCAIGPVTDSALRVHGIDGLRVADASVLPLIPNANTNATVLAVAERAAELTRSAAPPAVRQDPC